MIRSFLKKQAGSLISDALTRTFEVQPETLNSVASLVVYPPETKLGHIAFPCHSLSKQLRKAPQQIATTISEAIQAQGKSPWFARIETAAGYLNFFVDFENLHRHLMERSAQGSLLEKQPEGAKKVIVEYSQLNTHKAYHVGHLRNIVFGDCIANLVDASGKQVVRATYPGDLGTHIAKVLWYIRQFKMNEIPNEKQAEWLGDMYGESDEYLKSLAGTPREKEVKVEMGKALRDLENKTGPYYELYKPTKEWSLNQMKQILNWLGIHFDVWYFESECDAPARELVLKKFDEGFFVKSEGAIGLDLSAYDLGFAMFLKSDGTTLYLTKDIELLTQKFSDPNVELSIVVVDTRQTLHFRQLFKTAELMGLRPASDSLHLSYETVTDEKGEPCSSRGRTGFRLEQLSRIVSDKIIEKYLEPNRGQWTDAEIEETARKVALGALKYGFLKVDSNRVIKFVLDEWIQLEGDTGPYLQYVHARCCGVLNKVPRDSGPAPFELATEFDQELVLMLERFNDSVANAAKDFRPSILCSYLFDLCKVFNRFYKECPIKTAETAGQKNTRLTLVDLTARTLREGLAILGIPAPERL
ncbi:MAG: arginine--tRNA ligase [Bdellovibrionales bacterium GWB1_55_8]|nr:MAG: arginine--tRNA ligase [Bdellovibrionales bacterium GWB1_55_8]